MAGSKPQNSCKAEAKFSMIAFLWSQGAGEKRSICRRDSDYHFSHAQSLIHPSTIYPSTYSPTYLSFLLFSIYLFIHFSIHRSMHPSIHPYSFIQPTFIMPSTMPCNQDQDKVPIHHRGILFIIYLCMVTGFHGQKSITFYGLWNRDDFVPASQLTKLGLRRAKFFLLLIHAFIFPTDMDTFFFVTSRFS